jgi:hypothetical protein
MVMWAPFLYLAFGFWMQANDQIFSNNTGTMITLTDTFKANGPELGWPKIISSYPMLLGCILVLMILLTREKWEDVLRGYYPTGADALSGEEVLDPYFEALPIFAKRWWYCEELLCRDSLGLNILSDFAYTKFDKEFDYQPKNLKRQPLQGCFCFDILCNRRYEEAFQYLPYVIEDRNEYIIDGDDDEGNDGMQSDMVRLILNMAFLEESKAREFNFSPEYYNSMKKPVSKEAEEAMRKKKNASIEAEIKNRLTGEAGLAAILLQARNNKKAGKAF